MKLAKMFFMGIGVLFVLMIVMVAVFGGDSEKTESKPVAAEKSEKKKPAKKEVVNIDNYNKIKVGDVVNGEGGMSLEEVTAILGKPENKTESQSGEYVMQTVVWTAKGILNAGDNITVTFTNDKATAKAQFGLDD